LPNRCRIANFKEGLISGNFSLERYAIIKLYLFEFGNMDNLSRWSRFAFGAFRAVCISLVSFGAMTVTTAQELTSAGASAQSPGSASDKARIRVFGQNGTLVEFYENSQCVGGKGTMTKVFGGLGDAFSSFFGRSKNTSIGMKETPTTQNLAKRDGLLSKVYFREYEVPANQPLALRMHFQDIGSRSSCGDIGGTFKPEPGKEYEVLLDFEPKLCITTVQEILQDEQGAISLQKVALGSTYKCT
jgi:hypothetical protein